MHEYNLMILIFLFLVYSNDTSNNLDFREKYSNYNGNYEVSDSSKIKVKTIFKYYNIVQ